MKSPFRLYRDQPRLLHGADYNPEQWRLDPDILDADFKGMREAGCNGMSVGIFSWTLYEPEEGRFEFDWMKRLLDRMAEEKIVAYLATPTGSKPMWMSENYPEIRRVDRNGNRDRSGHRHNHCPSSPVYREKVAILDTRMAQTFGNHPALGLWHISNELSGQCYCDLCLGGFREWLRNRYGSLDGVNAAWWTRFWNHTFTAWEQIDPRDGSIDGLALDWKRFGNELLVDYLNHEVRTLKAVTPDIPCTTNFMGTHPGCNYAEWADSIDVISDDSYPGFDGSPDTWRHAARVCYVHEVMRSLKPDRPWILMECSPSLVNWKPVNRLKPDGVHLMEAAQCVAQGADAIHYFQWRKGRGGSEKYHGAVLDHDPRTDTRVFREVRRVGDFLSRLEPLAGSLVAKGPALLLHDWESRWAIETSHGIKTPPDGDVYTNLTVDHYQGLWRSGLAVDVQSLRRGKLPDLEGYRLIVLPAIYLMEEELAAALIAFAEAGGVLVLTHRAANVDPSNRVFLGGLPGCGLHQAAGVKVEEIHSLFDDERIAVADGVEVHESMGILHPTGAETVHTYQGGPVPGAPAVTRNPHGKGEIWMLGANFDWEFYADFYKRLVSDHAMPRVLETDLPTGVAATERHKDGERFVFVINYTADSHVLSLPADETWREVDGDSEVTGLDLAPFECQVLRRA